MIGGFGDGEMWMGRRTYQNCPSLQDICRSDVSCRSFMCSRMPAVKEAIVQSERESMDNMQGPRRFRARLNALGSTYWPCLVLGAPLPPVILQTWRLRRGQREYDVLWCVKGAEAPVTIRNLVALLLDAKTAIKTLNRFGTPQC